MRKPLKRFVRKPLVAVLGVLLVIPFVAVPAHAEPSRAELDRAIPELGKLQEDHEALIEQYNEITVKLADTRARLADAKAEYAKWSEEANTAQAELDQRTADLYMSGLDSRLDAFFGSGNFNDFSDRVTYLAAIADQNAAVAADATVTRQKADWAKEAAAKAEADIEKQQAELKEKQDQIEAQIGKQQDLVDSLQIQYDEAMAQWRAAQAAAAAAAAAADNGGNGGNGGTTSTSGGGDNGGEVTNPPPASSRASYAVSVAMDQQGDEYQWGAAGPDEFDCSGLTMYAWGKAGVSLPHSSASQYASLPHVSRDELQPGDLVFFYNPIHHVGMYIGGGMMVHAFSEGSPVGTDSVFGGYYGSVYTGAARPG